MKKCLLFLALIVANLADANTFYIGGSVGVSALDSKKDHQILNATGTVLKDERHDLGKFGFIGGGFVGYNYDTLCSFDAGVEFFANGFTSEAKINHYDSSSVTIPSVLKVSQYYNFGVRVLPGYWLSSCVEGHAIIGYTRGGFKLTDDGVYGIVSESFGLNGYQVGLGTTLKLSQCLSLRVDGIYSGYPQHENITGLAPSVAQGGPTGGTTTNYCLSTSAMDTTVSLVYSY